MSRYRICSVLNCTKWKAFQCGLFQWPMEWPGFYHHCRFASDLLPSLGDVTFLIRWPEPNPGRRQLPLRPQCHATDAEGSGKHSGVESKSWGDADRVVQDRCECQGHILAIFGSRLGVFNGDDQSIHGWQVVQLASCWTRKGVVRVESFILLSCDTKGRDHGGDTSDCRRWPSLHPARDDAVGGWEMGKGRGRRQSH